MPWKPSFLKKTWEREECVFTVQEHGVTESGKGWSDITKPTGVVPTSAECGEIFEPGRYYRVLARYISGDRAGQLAGVVWKHFEKPLGGLVKKEKPPKVKKEAAKKVTMAELVGISGWFC